MLDYFAEKEYPLVEFGKKIKKKVLGPLTKPLIRLGIHPNHISSLGVLVLIGFIYFVQINPLYATFFLLLNFFLDNLDGTLAREMGKESEKGAFVDIICDHTSLVIVVLTFLAVGLANPLNLAIYLYLYTLLIFLLMVRNKLDKPIHYVIRSKYYLYLLYLIWAFFSINYLDYGVLLFSLLMIYPIMNSIRVIKRSLK